ncbi:uncharacterized protein P884DRAFT_256359 [Thermothelomyces heterothallicus CBS 202.75]|uniref:uncharacterized protein n=1 Tax=Thermothelomyces heterothallicus CBS 202.75 TaxID=1149848 RepID=UPI0037433D21
MQFRTPLLLLLGNAVFGLALPSPAGKPGEDVLEKHCISSGGDCTNRYTECCSQQCSISHDGSDFCF